MTALDAPSPFIPVQGAVRPGAVEAPVRGILRLEGLAVLVGATAAYHALNANWLVFAFLFLLPDLSMLGYFASRSIGARVYNIGHSYLSPAALALAGYLAGQSGSYGVALIWAAHIGFDRVLGYGLKYPTAFGDTHLGLKVTRS